MALRIASLIILTLLCFLREAECANIVFFHHLSSYSHRIISYPLAFALAERGHQITMISPHQLRETETSHPNITEIVPRRVEKRMQDFMDISFNINLRVQKQLPRLVHALFPTAITMCEDLLDSEEFHEFFKSTTKVDLVILDNCFTECFSGLIYKHRAKHIFLNMLPFFPHEYDIHGITPETSGIPELEMDPPDFPMTFLQRVFNTFISIHFRYEHVKYLTKIDAIVRKYEDVSDMPFVDEVVRNASLVLYTGDVVSDYPRLQPPSVVNVAGIHCKSNSKSLPQDIQDFINSTTNDGLVFISLGSVVAASDLPKKIHETFFDTIDSFPQLKFLWKWEGKLPHNTPKNLFLAKWFPQMDILGHSRTRAFITQGGRPSTLEGIYNGVPMIAFPILADQDVNSKRINQMGGNIMLELGTVTRTELINAVNTTVYDTRMRDRMKELSHILVDRQNHPLKTAVWWVEYVLRHKDTTHLRPPAFQQYWFQRRLLDVWAFVFVSVGTTLVFSVVLIVITTKILHKYLLLLLSKKIKNE